ncbi:MAG: anhydro-N-acetylmuramic acid kinase [Alphaproteobacteria bacterium]|nr:anhydro-N-acetylmuramic acid kinase [Alphaproteobacteria bacterium]
MKPKLYKALGLMSGTSLDGIDLALIETDGADYVRPLGAMGRLYDEGFRNSLRQQLGHRRTENNPSMASVERTLTEKHAEIVCDFLAQSGEMVDVIGFHGQTIYHNPAAHETLQLGDGALLAELTGIDVVNDFRSADVLAGGHGAPFVPLYHRALVAIRPKPMLILNIGGVSNITWIGGVADEQLLAFDVGPGNALIDDWVLTHTGRPYDHNGELAAIGTVAQDLVACVFEKPFFREPPPKSLDRDAFGGSLTRSLSVEDGAATLTRITARAVALALPFLPQIPQEIYVAGGGRHNGTLMRWIGDETGLAVHTVDELGWSGDALEAQAFAWLAVRSILRLPLSLPKTTGVPSPMTGGFLHKAP